MPDAPPMTEHAAPDAPTVGFNWEAFRAACREQGAHTAAECAALTGIPVRTLYEMRRRPESAALGNALQIRKITRLGLDELYPVRCGEAA